jgi:hypothetical protein
MDADDFQVLYKLLRGSRTAMMVLDAKALFLDDKMVDAQQKLAEAREVFLESRSRLLTQDLEKQVDPKAADAAQQRKKLARKKEKVEETVEAFDELVAAIDRNANRERAHQARDTQHAAGSEPPARDPAAVEDSLTQVGEPDALAAAGPSDLSEEFLTAYAASTGDQRLEVISHHFGFREVQSENEIYPDTLYFIQTGRRSLLVRTPGLDEMTHQVALIRVEDDRPIKPFSRDAFIRLGTERKMVVLTRRPARGEAAPQDGGPA